MSAATHVQNLLRARGADKTICPSEVARNLAIDCGGEWQDRMSEVHEAVDSLLAAGRITLSWRGVRLLRRAGPYRISVAD